MKVVFLLDGATPRQALNTVQPGEVILMYAEKALITPVAQVCRTQESYFVAGPRFNGQVGDVTMQIDHIVEVNGVVLFNKGQADERGRIYPCATPEEATQQLQQLFKQQ